MSTTVRFSVPEFDRMIQAGVFAERANQRIELIYGEMREVNPPNPPHEDIVDKLMYWSMDRAPRDQVRIRIQNSLGIPALDSLTIPDVAWMVARDYHRQRPEPADVLLLIEVADSTLQSDRKEKGPLYAAAGIQEYWIVNVNDQCLEVYRNPMDGAYSQLQTIHLGNSMAPAAFPEWPLDVSQLFGVNS